MLLCWLTLFIFLLDFFDDVYIDAEKSISSSINLIVSFDYFKNCYIIWNINIKIDQFSFFEESLETE